MNDMVDRLAEAIWTTSRADEGTISATGAKIVAQALLPLVAEAWDKGSRRGWTLYNETLATIGSSNPYREASR